MCSVNTRPKPRCCIRLRRSASLSGCATGRSSKRVESLMVDDTWANYQIQPGTLLDSTLARQAFLAQSARHVERPLEDDGAQPSRRTIHAHVKGKNKGRTSPKDD